MHVHGMMPACVLIGGIKVVDYERSSVLLLTEIVLFMND